MIITTNQNQLQAHIETLRRQIENYSDFAWCVSRNNIIALLKQERDEVEFLAREVEQDALMQEVVDVLEAA